MRRSISFVGLLCATAAACSGASDGEGGGGTRGTGGSGTGGTATGGMTASGGATATGGRAGAGPATGGAAGASAGGASGAAGWVATGGASGAGGRAATGGATGTGGGAGLGGSGPPPVAGDEFFVATTGDDANPGTKDRPFKTIAAAQMAVRNSPDRGKTPITVTVASGTYYVGKTIVFSSADSGTQAAPVTYRGLGTATLSGGVPLNSLSWTPFKNGILQATVPASMFAKTTVGQTIPVGIYRSQADRTLTITR